MIIDIAIHLHYNVKSNITAIFAMRWSSYS